MDSDDDNIRQTLDLIEDMAINAPSALAFLVINAINELRGAVDDGHSGPELQKRLLHTLSRLPTCTTTLQPTDCWLARCSALDGEIYMKDFLGVLGGMGPLATADFLRKLVKKTPAKFDQEHIPVMLWGDCTTPDRTANILGIGDSPLPNLLAGIRALTDAGAKAICIPCNSAHCWYDEMSAATHLPVLHIVRASVAQIIKKNPAARAVGVLSTQGTHQMGIYRKTLAEAGYEVVTPTDEEFETLVSPGIAMLKANDWAGAEAAYEKAAQLLTSRGAEITVLGCTEIPFGMERQYRANPMKFVDSNDALVDAVLTEFDRSTNLGDL